MDYRPGKKIFEVGSFVWLEGQGRTDQDKVSLKTFDIPYPAPEAVLRFRREFKLLKQLTHPGFIRVFDWVEEGNKMFMVSEQLDGVPLSGYAQQQFDLELFFDLALKLTNAIDYFHENGYIHRGLHPQSLFVGPGGRDLKIIDCYSFADNTYEQFEPINAFDTLFELGYCSPEQTGRMNKKLDYRTDFYTLGVLFFEMLAGCRPFVSSDPLELIHAHIAKTAPDLGSLRADIPPALRAVVKKLLAKNPEDRYQSANGLEEDLKYCMNSRGLIASFVPGLKDERVSFQIPQKLYGRDKELTSLMSSFERIHTGELQLILVYGYSGIGKSSLIAELHKPLLAKKGYFVTGKFDQYKRNIPYSALIHAFENLIDLILQEREDRIEYWKNKLTRALEDGASVITEVIPHLELIIGKPAKAKELPPQEAENRFQRLILSFIDAISSEEHPIILFLDDLQWADTSTLNLLEIILTKQRTNNMLIIGAFRDNEVPPGHPLDITIGQLHQAAVQIQRIELEPLSGQHIRQLIADTLHMGLEEIQSLAGLAEKKTRGNPFFLIRFLKTLHEEQYIRYHKSERKWTWDLERIDRIGYSRGEKWKYGRRLRFKQFWMKKWARSAPDNFAHKQLLIQAERARNRGKISIALDGYDRAIEGAVANEFWQDAALANELAAQCLIDYGRKKLAEVYIQEAYYYYLKWGAQIKAQHFKEKYDQFVDGFKADGNTESGNVGKSKAGGSSVDVFSIIKASTAISREINLRSLLETMIRIIVENTGSQRGLLILEQHNHLLIEAETITEPPKTVVLQSIRVKDNPTVPESLIRFVARTKESVVLNNAFEDGQFGQDAYIRKAQSKSILCAPVLSQNRLVGLVYLENNLTHHAFRPRQVEIVDILTSVAANSIENAKLYENLHQLNINLRTEVVQRKAAQEAVAASEQRLQQYLEGIPVGVAVLTAEGRPFYMNRTAFELLGKGLDPNVNATEISRHYRLFKAGSEAHYPVEELPIVQALQGRSLKVRDIEIKRPDKVITIEGSATPIYENGEIIFAIAVFKDISKELESELAIQQSLDYQTNLVKSYSRFVPQEFLDYLDKPSVMNVDLADHIIDDMTVLFADIRSYTTLSETMSLDENFQFLNKYLSIVSPIIEGHNGLINQYYGDGIMSLFKRNAEDALQAAISTFGALEKYNAARLRKGRAPIRIGIGLHTGPLVLGIIGTSNRMDATVISDAVNTASRMEGLTKIFGAAIILSDVSYREIRDPQLYNFRFLGKVRVKGKENHNGIYECFDGEPAAVVRLKLDALSSFEAGLEAYYQRDFQQAVSCFERVLSLHPDDKAAQFYLHQSKALKHTDLSDHWEGVIELTYK